VTRPNGSTLIFTPSADSPAEQPSLTIRDPGNLTSTVGKRHGGTNNRPIAGPGGIPSIALNL
jgi:hypothetical protein